MLEPTQDNEQIIERIAALDIGKAELVCCVRVPDGQAAGKRLQEVATYPTMTRSLLGMCDRLRQVGVTRVVMEATSDYWKPPFYLLEAADLADHGRVSPRPGRQVDAAADAMPGRQHDSCLLATHRQTTAVTMI